MLLSLDQEGAFRGRAGSLGYKTTALSVYEPVVNDPAELGLNAAQQLQLQEVLTQAISTPVAGTHAAEAGVAADRHREMRVFTT